MPELPEVQAHAERLSAAFAGADLSRFQPLAFTALKTYDPPPEAAVGRALEAVRRRGKYLLLDFGDLTFVVHLMQGGRLRVDGTRPRPGSRRPAVRPKGGVARWVFADDRGLLLTEAGTEHRAGVWVVAGDPLAVPPLSELGPEADAVDEEGMAALLAAHPMRLHTFLRDQRVVAGLGRRLANEVCHRARLSPFAPTAKLSVDAGRVVDAIRSCVLEGLAAEQAREDMSASRERPAAVHGRTGEACPACGDTVRAVGYRDYTVNYCPTCQTGGRVLADNTTSKFLK
ncbi:MAG TPA: DNA-formamidopyrimidine glycosylase family protein [Egibacteraceae bacterium]|jgi:formamidopyrimidine-DNA glycosylase|nr:DNA-formamidopyrimidine glycosylase family protein [Egibacteraceae bacterium]